MGCGCGKKSKQAIKKEPMKVSKAVRKDGRLIINGRKYRVKK